MVEKENKQSAEDQQEKEQIEEFVSQPVLGKRFRYEKDAVADLVRKR
jgi:hypothetical protein